MRITEVIKANWPLLVLGAWAVLAFLRNGPGYVSSIVRAARIGLGAIL